MLVISDALALSPAYAPSANNPIIGWRNLVTVQGVSADSEDAGYPAVNLANPSTSVKQQWRSTSTATQYVTFTLATERPVDYVGLARHNFGSGQIEITAQYPDPDNPGQWLDLAGPFAPGTDEAIILRGVPVYVDTLRLKLVPSDVPPWLAVAYVGELLVLPRRIYVGHTPLHMGGQAEIVTGMSESGEFLGRTLIRDERSTGFTMSNVNPAWLRANMLSFFDAAKTKPFFFAWRPQDYPLESGFAWLTNSPRPVNQRSNGMMSVEFQLGGLAL